MDKKKTLLLVEDETLIAMAQKMYLEQYGYDEIDLVLMDIDLGKGMDGTQAAKAILEHRDIPILFLSSHTESDVVEKTEKITSYGYVVKNSSITVLDASIKMAFKLFEANGKLKLELRERKEIERGLELTRLEVQKLQVKADEVSRFAQSVIDTIREPLLSLDQDLRVVTASRSFCDFFKVKPEDTVGQLVYDLGNKQWDIPKLRELLEEILPRKTTFDDYEVEHDFATIGRRTMLLNARQINQAQGARRIILLAIEDITARKEIEVANKALLDRQNLILKEVHHRIKNSMNTLRSLLQLQADSLSDPGAIAALIDTDGRLVSMMTLYDKLYRSVEYNDLSIKDYLQSLVDEVLANFPKAGLIRVEKDLQDFSLDARVMQSIGIIVNELLTNIMKYAFKGRKSGLIRVSACCEGGFASIIVSDDGAGVPESVNFDNSPGFGLMLVRTLTEQIGGTISMDRAEGTIVTIAFKV